MNIKQFCVPARLVIVALIMIYFEIMLLYVYRNVSEDEIYILYFYHFLLLAFIYSYYKTSVSNPGIVTQKVAESYSMAELKRECKYCQRNKPIRSHHCKKCNKCILRMGNHCSWASNCIGKNNYKFFFCLLFYLNVTLITYFIIFVKKVYENPQNETFNIFFINFQIVLCLIMLVLQLIYLGFHIKLMIHNKTLIEHFEKRGENYDRELWANCEEFLGSNWWLWLVPI